jgi:hypothetical protein
LCQHRFRDADGWSGKPPSEGSCNHKRDVSMGDISTVGGHAAVMLTALLACFLLITVAWALRDSNAVLERHIQCKHWDD